MSLADRMQFLEILEREVQTCESQTLDLYALTVSASRHYAASGAKSINATTFIREVRDEFMTGRSFPSELELLTDISSPSDELSGDIRLWKVLAMKMMDYGLANAHLPGKVWLLASHNSLKLTVPNLALNADEIEALGSKLPQRASRRHFNPHLGMGAYLVFNLARNQGLDAEAQTVDGSLIIKVFKSQK